MKLVVGLGNPGSSYKNTRHNIGFSLLDFICSDRGINLNKRKFNGLYAEVDFNGEKVILLKPLSFMNLSGSVVSKYVSYFKVKCEDILIIQDDLDMRLGRVKFVHNSSSGGHNGIRDIERCLGTNGYARLKIGISNDKDVDTRDYVLGKFDKESLEILNNTYRDLVNVIDDFCVLSLEQLMSKYNHK